MHTRGDVAAITIGTLNLLGAGHTSGARHAGQGSPGWENRLPRAMSTLQNAGVSIAALQEVHRPQGRALATRYSQQWGMYPADAGTQNVVIWDRNAWTATNQQLVKIPYFGGRETPMPMVQLTSTTTGQSIWVWSIHNPADVHGRALGHRQEALRRQLATMRQLTSSGTPAVLIGGLQRRQGRPRGLPLRAHPHPGQRLRRVLRTVPATQGRCTDRPHLRRQPHLGQRLGRPAAPSAEDQRPPAGGRHHRRQQRRLRGRRRGSYHLGAVKPELAKLVDVLAPMFDIKTVGGYRESRPRPRRPSLRARGGLHGPAQRRPANAKATRWPPMPVPTPPSSASTTSSGSRRIWSTSRAGEGWRPMADRGSATENHRDHVHINVKAGASVRPVGDTNAGCDEIVAPLPADLLGTDQHNWHDSGSHWGSWHTGTDFSVPCGTPVYAANAGTVEVDTTQAWAGRWLVKVHTGPGSLTTWYAHMRKVTVARGAESARRPADRRGRRTRATRPAATCTSRCTRRAARSTAPTTSTRRSGCTDDLSTRARSEQSA